MEQLLSWYITGLLFLNGSLKGYQISRNTTTFGFPKMNPVEFISKSFTRLPNSLWCYWKIAQSFPLPHSCQPNWIQQGWAKNERSTYSVRSGPFASLEQRTWLHKHLKLFLSTQEALYFENLQVFIFALICMYKFWALTRSTMIYHYIATHVYWGFRFKLNEIINRWISSPVWLFTSITLPRLNRVSLTFNPEWIFIRSFSLLFNLSLHSRHGLGSLKLMEFFFFFGKANLYANNQKLINLWCPSARVRQYAMHTLIRAAITITRNSFLSYSSSFKKGIHEIDYNERGGVKSDIKTLRVAQHLELIFPSISSRLCPSLRFCSLEIYWRLIISANLIWHCPGIFCHDCHQYCFPQVPLYWKNVAAASRHTSVVQSLALIGRAEWSLFFYSKLTLVCPMYSWLITVRRLLTLTGSRHETSLPKEL